MTLYDDILTNTYHWFAVAKPNHTMKTFTVQLGVHFEEVAEMTETLIGMDRVTQALFTQALLANHALAMHLKTTNPQVIVKNRAELLDALADQVVTAAGVAHEQNLGLVGALDEVNDSNYSKFVDGKAIFDANGKIAKGPNYRKADLAAFVGPNPNY